jgi:hypothetical protein
LKPMLGVKTTLISRCKRAGRLIARRGDNAFIQIRLEE